MGEHGLRAKQKEDRRRAILDAALAEFVENGFAGARIGMIAEEAGLSKGALYGYIESKDQLFKDVVRDAMRQAMNEIATSFQSTPAVADGKPVNAKQILANAVRQAYGSLGSSQRHSVTRLIIAEGERFPDLAASFYREFFGVAREAVKSMLEAGEKAGALRQGAASLHPFHIMGPAIVLGLTYSMLHDVRGIDVEMFAEQHLDLLWHGLAGPQGED